MLNCGKNIWRVFVADLENVYRLEIFIFWVFILFLMDIWCSCVLYFLWRDIRLYMLFVFAETLLCSEKEKKNFLLAVLLPCWLTPFIFVVLKLKFLRRKLFECVGWCKSSASYFIFHAVYNLLVWKFHRSSPQHCWRNSYFFYAVSILCRQFSATFELEHIFLPSRSYSLFLQPLAHNILQSCHGLRNYVLLDTVFQQTKQVQCKDCTGEGGSNTVWPYFLIASVLHTLVCGELWLLFWNRKHSECTIVP